MQCPLVLMEVGEFSAPCGECLVGSILFDCLFEDEQKSSDHQMSNMLFMEMENSSNNVLPDMHDVSSKTIQAKHIDTIIKLKFTQ